jgi:hypothetical protein
MTSGTTSLLVDTNIPADLGTAPVNDIPTIVSGNFNFGAVLDGIRFVNPFDPAFKITDL